MAEFFFPDRPERTDIRATAKPPPASAITVTFVVVVAALYFGREVFVPLALAILLSFVLAPLVLLLRRLHVARVPSVVSLCSSPSLLSSASAPSSAAKLRSSRRTCRNIKARSREDPVRARHGGREQHRRRASSMIKDLRTEITQGTRKPEPGARDMRPPNRRAQISSNSRFRSKSASHLWHHFNSSRASSDRYWDR